MVSGIALEATCVPLIGPSAYPIPTRGMQPIACAVMRHPAWRWLPRIVLGVFAFCVLLPIVNFTEESFALRDARRLLGLDFDAQAATAVAEDFMALLEQGRGAEAVELFGDPSCFAESADLEDADLEDLEYWYRGFEFDPYSSRIKETSGTVIGRLSWDEPSYGHISSVYLRRAGWGEPWQVCNVGISGYS